MLLLESGVSLTIRIRVGYIEPVLSLFVCEEGVLQARDVVTVLLKFLGVTPTYLIRPASSL